MILERDHIDLSTATGLMRTHRYRPAARGRHPAVILFSEIFQHTSPIERIAAMLAGHGFLVVVPEIFHEFEQPGFGLPYDKSGTIRGNGHKVRKPVSAHDSDARACIDHLLTDNQCSGKMAAVGVCIGGHLSFRCALQPEVLAGVCFYATDLHSSSLGPTNDDSLARAGELKGELLMVWGRQDPHIPPAGRSAIHKALSDHHVNFTWHEVNAAHAFLRDEGKRYDPALALTFHRITIDLLNRVLR